MNTRNTRNSQAAAFDVLSLLPDFKGNPLWFDTTLDSGVTPTVLSNSLPVSNRNHEDSQEFSKGGLTVSQWGYLQDCHVAFDTCCRLFA